MINEITLRELDYKITVIIKYLQKNGGYDYLLYNRTCPYYSDEPDSDIVEYAYDVKNIINDLNKDPDDLDFPF